MRAIIITLSIFLASQAQAYTFSPYPVKPYDCPDCEQLSHERIQKNWPVTELPFNKKESHIQKSVSYYQKVTAKQLQQGVALYTHAPGAVIQVIALENKNMPVLQLGTPNNQMLELDQASTLLSQDESSSESLLPIKHQTMMQVKPELGFGHFIIKSKVHSAEDAQAYMIHVYDKYALIYLQIEPGALQYQYGDQVTATISLKDNENTYALNDINARLKGPDDQIVAVKLKEIKKNVFQASTTMLSETNSQGGNWYIEVEVKTEQEDMPVYRTGRAAFSYSIPSASILSIKKISSKPLVFAATVDVATPSRYALQTVLFYKNTTGKTIPLETSQNAQWLNPGKQVIKFSFDNSLQLAEDRLALGYLHLTDYGQLKTVFQYNAPIKLTEFTE